MNIKVGNVFELYTKYLKEGPNKEFDALLWTLSIETLIKSSCVGANFRGVGESPWTSSFNPKKF